MCSRVLELFKQTQVLTFLSWNFECQILTFLSRNFECQISNFWVFSLVLGPQNSYQKCLQMCFRVKLAQQNSSFNPSQSEFLWEVPLGRQISKFWVFFLVPGPRKVTYTVILVRPKTGESAQLSFVPKFVGEFLLIWVNFVPMSSQKFADLGEIRPNLQNFARTFVRISNKFRPKKKLLCNCKAYRIFLYTFVHSFIEHIVNFLYTFAHNKVCRFLVCWKTFWSVI
jgi:hypothetical protein